MATSRPEGCQSTQAWRGKESSGAVGCRSQKAATVVVITFGWLPRDSPAASRILE